MVVAVRLSIRLDMRAAPYEAPCLMSTWKR